MGIGIIRKVGDKNEKVRFSKITFGNEPQRHNKLYCWKRKRTKIGKGNDLYLLINYDSYNSFIRVILNKINNHI